MLVYNRCRLMDGMESDMEKQKMRADELKQVLDQIEAIIREAAEIILGARDQAMHSRTKSSVLDLVTEYDVRVQQFLEKHLRALLPEAGFLGEEEGMSDVEGRRYYFIVDPIDGTSNFVADYHHSGISVALMMAGEPRPTPVLAAIYNPYLGEMFTAIEGQGASLNGDPIEVAHGNLRDGLILFGTSPYRRELAEGTFAVIKELYYLSRDLRRGGAAVLDMSYIACGRGALFFEVELSPWDYAAAALIVAEAGGVITDLSGAPLSFTEKSGVVAGPEEHHNTCIRLIKEIGLA